MFKEQQTSDGAICLSVRLTCLSAGLKFLSGLFGCGFMAFCGWQLAVGGGQVDALAWPVVGGFSLFFIGLTYVSLASMLNTLHIRLDGERMKVSQTPLPLGRGFTVPLDQVHFVRRLTVRHTTSSRNGTGRSVGGSSTFFTERIAVITIDGAQRTLLEHDDGPTLDAIAERIAEYAGLKLLADEDESAPPLPPSKRLLPDVPTAPRGISLHESVSRVLVRIRWFHWRWFVWLFGCILMCAPTGFAWLMVIAFTRVSVLAWLGMAIPLVFSGLIILCAYEALAGLCNVTVLEVTRGMLRRKHRPLPWFGNKTIPCANILNIVSRYQALADSNESRTAQCFAVICKKRDGTEVVLYSKLTGPQASFVADILSEACKRFG